jgi:hypothetical protein
MLNMKMTNPVLAVAREDYAEDLVTIVDAAIAQCAPAGRPQSIGATLPSDAHACLAMEGIPYLIAMNSVNYQFWEVAGTGEFVRYRHNGLEGALAMQQAFRQAWEEEAGRLGPAARATIDALRERIATDGLSGIFGDIPAAASRTRILLEVLGDASRLYETSASLCDAVALRGELGWQQAELLARMFPLAYGDRYLKKAQLTLMFIAGQWNAHGHRRTCHLDVTAAADYQLPKILRAMGILRYAPELAARVDSQQLIEADSRDERAIRAATVFACEKLAAHLGCTVPEVDFWLWVNRNQARDAKFHLTRATAY